MIWVGCSLAIYSGLLSPILALSLSKKDKETYCMYAMAVFGLGEMAGAMCIGQIVDRLNSKVAALFNALVILMTVVLTELFLYPAHPSYSYLAFVMAFAWGFQDGSSNTHCLQMLGFEFTAENEPSTVPFAIFSMLEAVGVFVFQVIQSFVEDQQTYRVYIGVMGVVGAISCGYTYWFPFKEKRANKNNT